VHLFLSYAFCQRCPPVIRVLISPLHISLPLRKSTATITIDTIPEIVHPLARARLSPCFFIAALNSLLFSRRLLAQRGWITSRLDRHHLLH
jgi:hypothetical protein